MVTKIRRYELTEEEWEHIKPYIPEEQEAGTRGRPSRVQANAERNLLDSSKRRLMERSS